MKNFHGDDSIRNTIEKLREEAQEAENRRRSLQGAIQVLEERMLEADGRPVEEADDSEPGPYAHKTVKAATLLVFKEAQSPLAIAEVHQRLIRGGWYSGAKDPRHMVSRRILQLHEAGELERVAPGVYKAVS